MSNVNRQYKDRLFRRLFGSIEMKDNILSLYNALNDSNYTDVDELELRTLEEAIYIEMKNDVAFLIDSHLSLWEQQSSFNPNMPIRGLMYFGELYSAYLTKHGCNIYGSKLIKIPTPQYIVFYNGKEIIDPIVKLRLSDAFINARADRDFEWTATMYNLNRGNNEDLLSKCKPLADYMTLINYINEYVREDNSLELAVDMAVDRCIKENVLKEFLLKHKAEVKDMVITEYNEEVFVNGIRNEGYEDGIAQGKELGRREGLRQVRSEGQSELVRAVELLRQGKTTDELIESGIDQKTVDLATTIM